MKRTPVLANAEITSVVSGPITYSPDAIPLLGPDAEIPNMWLALGTGYGIGLAGEWWMFFVLVKQLRKNSSKTNRGWKTSFLFLFCVFPSGGVGKYLSDWMIDGEPPYDLLECEPGRYGNWITREYVLAKARETYGLNNEMIHPKLERWAGRPVRTSQIYEVTGFCLIRSYTTWSRCTQTEGGETLREDRPFRYWKLGGVDWMKESFSAHLPLLIWLSLADMERTFLSNPFVCVYWRPFCASS